MVAVACQTVAAEAVAGAFAVTHSQSCLDSSPACSSWATESFHRAHSVVDLAKVLVLD